ncbi:MAG: hypothetical protein QNI99_18540 [Woeseiaceae bacterium]|nr:hypothetical protein [Woeseiaceae bacterium]
MLKLAGLVVVLLLLWYLLMRRSSGSAAKQQPQLEQHKPHTGGEFHAVSIKFDADACLHAKALQGRRFLAREAPNLPLDNCDASKCNCRFVHHDDRRSGKDRRSPFGSGGMGAVTGRFEAERRQGGDRRRHTPRADDD